MLAVLASVGWLAAVSVSLLALSARRLLVRRTELVARASHELRGPITALRLGLHGPELSQARLRAVDLELGRAALALDDLTAAIGCGPVGLAIEPLDAVQLLADSVEAWRPVARQRHTKVTLSWAGVPASVLGDRYRLAQATDNLIANAIEHGAGAVEVSVRRDGASVRIQVTDDGPGLPAPISDLGGRAHAGSGRRARGQRRRRRGQGQSPRGRGRGLAIASQVARDHGGRLAAAPSERGARVVLELPAADTGLPAEGREDGVDLT